MEIYYLSLPFVPGWTVKNKLFYSQSSFLPTEDSGESHTSAPHPDHNPTPNLSQHTFVPLDFWPISDSVGLNKSLPKEPPSWSPAL